MPVPNPIRSSLQRMPARGPARRGQRGVALFVALITVAAMSLVAVAMYRSVDIATLQSGNIALMADQTNKADMCVRRAITWLSSGAVNMQSGTNDAARNYYGVQFTPAQLDARYGMHKSLIASSDNSWMGSAPDINAGEGVRVNCVIERVCRRVDEADASHCQMPGGALGGQGKAGSEFPKVAALPVFRVTTRVDGTKGVTFSKVTLGPRQN